jgi:hypothetical protein
MILLQFLDSITLMYGFYLLFSKADYDIVSQEIWQAFIFGMNHEHKIFYCTLITGC